MGRKKKMSSIDIRIKMSDVDKKERESIKEHVKNLYQDISKADNPFYSYRDKNYKEKSGKFNEDGKKIEEKGEQKK